MVLREVFTPRLYVLKRSVHATPVSLKAKCSRHAGTVASHCRFAPMFASARPPWRCPFDVFSDSISAVKEIKLQPDTTQKNWGQVPIKIGVRFQLIHATPENWGQVPINSRHAGTVAAHCRFAPMFASARPPWRCPFDVFSDCISAVKETKLQPDTTQRPTEGAFFSSESAEKNRTG